MANRGLLLIAFVAVFALSACTSGSESPVSTVVPIVTTTTTPVDGVEATAEFLECMSGNGFELAELPFDADGRPRLESLSGQLDYSDPAATQALSVCAGFLSDGALDLGYDEEYRVAVVGQLAVFSRCLRARGVENFPDPIPGFIGIGSPFPVVEIPYDDPDLPDAVVACQITVFGESGIIDG